MRLALLLLLVALLASCHQAPPANPHYVLGAPYSAGGVWYYPRENYAAHETGLATVYGADHADFTADGEVFDQTALAAAHQTLQLPAIARITNLENSLAVVVRINDRGPASPHRLIEVTRRTATLLAFPSDGVARVRLDVLPEESQAAVEAVPGAPTLQISSAPLGEVTQTNLPPPGSAAPANVAAPVSAAAQTTVANAPPLRLPETVTQGSRDPGELFVELSSFHNFQYANVQRARVAGLGATVVTRSENGAKVYRVMIGPFTSVQQADAVLDQVLAAGVTDARIVVE